MAHVLLLAALVLLLLEVVLAWRFGRHTKVDGAATPPAIGRTWPITAAVVFGLIFAGLAFVRIHAARSGDFMSFLPDDWRSRAEKFLGVPPAPPGEGNFWELASRSDLFGVGNDFWPSLGILLAGLCLIFYVYKADGPQVECRLQNAAGRASGCSCFCSCSTSCCRSSSCASTGKAGPTSC